MAQLEIFDNDVSVEEIIPAFDLCGRQAVFKVPKTFNKNEAKRLLDKFIYVFD